MIVNKHSRWILLVCVSVSNLSRVCCKGEENVDILHSVYVRVVIARFLDFKCTGFTRDVNIKRKIGKMYIRKQTTEFHC